MNLDTYQLETPRKARNRRRRGLIYNNEMLLLLLVLHEIDRLQEFQLSRCELEKLVYGFGIVAPALAVIFVDGAFFLRERCCNG
jgi:hypothetical protein